MQRFVDMNCRKCGVLNPLIFFAPISVAPYSCICMNCARQRGWLDNDGNLKEGIKL